MINGCRVKRAIEAKAAAPQKIRKNEKSISLCSMWLPGFWYKAGGGLSKFTGTLG